MITKLFIFEGDGFDPHNNLATEKRLMDIVPQGACLLYLWQNKNTVVIGRNQNPWLECRTSLLEEEGGKLARRLSGGGAVYHDLGNLNFTFIMGKEDYDLDKQLSVIQKACALAGITAEKSGRNDLLADGRKFSGNAFFQNRTHAYHHGTLMVNVDREKLGRYLSPPKAKLEAKGIASVRSRVVNLTELAPALTIDRMKQYMVAAFTDIYGGNAEPLVLTEEDKAAIDALRNAYGSWEYLYGTPLPFSFSCESHFSWGHINLQLDAKDGIISGAKLYSDSMDWTLPEAVESALTGCRFDTAEMQKALQHSPLAAEIRNDLCQMLAAQTL
ncbi:MAG: lipoate--protein ligase [Oscillospiraceae bacterium]|nr:lipoate--protein ligase [Oscillospiraceae bacterium]